MEADPYSCHKQYQILLEAKSASKSMEKSEGLSCLSGDCWSDVNVEMDLPWQFGPGSRLDVDSQYVNVEESTVPGLGGTAILKTCKKASDSELEWQWILDQQQTYNSEWFPSKKRDDSNEIDNPGDAAQKEQITKAETDSSVITSSLFSGSKTEGSSDAGTSNASKISGNLSAELNTSKPSHRDGMLWRNADSKELAALVWQKGHGYLENCDLPPSQSSLTRKGPLANLDVFPSKDMKSCSSSVDNAFLASLCRPAPIGSENRSLPSCGSKQPYEHPPRLSESQPVPSAAIKRGSPKETMNWKVSSERHSGVTNQGFEALGEALCHSQTRARQAEKLAAQAMQEREKFAQLLFKESWTTRTYKHWVQTLELENMWLKLCSGSDFEVWMGKGLTNTSTLTGQTIMNPWQQCGKNLSRKKMNRHGQSRWEGKHSKHASESNIWLRCTLGLAFALGISFAGAGLMIGWSMGWILLSH